MKNFGERDSPLREPEASVGCLGSVRSSARTGGLVSAALVPVFSDYLESGDEDGLPREPCERPDDPQTEAEDEPQVRGADDQGQHPVPALGHRKVRSRAKRRQIEAMADDIIDVGLDDSIDPADKRIRVGRFRGRRTAEAHLAVRTVRMSKPTRRLK